MTEKMNPKEELNCPRCGQLIGHIVGIEGEDLVQIGGLIVRELEGSCSQCGRGYYYSLNARRLEGIIERLQERKMRLHS